MLVLGGINFYYMQVKYIYYKILRHIALMTDIVEKTLIIGNRC